MQGPPGPTGPAGPPGADGTKVRILFKSTYSYMGQVQVNGQHCITLVLVFDFNNNLFCRGSKVTEVLQEHLEIRVKRYCQTYHYHHILNVLYVNSDYFDIPLRSGFVTILMPHLSLIWFVFFQGVPGPPGYPGAAGAMGQPVSILKLLFHKITLPVYVAILKNLIFLLYP